MNLRHTFDPPDWNFPSDAQTHSLHKSGDKVHAVRRKQCLRELFFSVITSPFLGVCGQVRSRCLIIAFVTWIGTETMLRRNKSQTVYMRLLARTPRSTLVISHRDSFTLKVVNKKIPFTSGHHRRAKFSCGVSTRITERKGLAWITGKSFWLIMQPHVFPLFGMLHSSSQSKPQDAWFPVVRWLRSIVSARLEQHKHTTNAHLRLIYSPFCMERYWEYWVCF